MKYQPKMIVIKIKATVWAKGAVFRAEETAEDMYAAMDLLTDKLEKQLRRYKDKLKDHNRHGEGREVKETFSLLGRSNNGTAPSKGSEKRHYVPKPMHPGRCRRYTRRESFEFSYVPECVNRRN